MAPEPGESALQPPGPALRVAVRWAPSEVVWGGTWAVVCGSAAALPWSDGLGGAVRFAAAWLAAVPLLGAFWAPDLNRYESSSAPRAGLARTRRFLGIGRSDTERGLLLAGAVVIGGLLASHVALTILAAPVLVALPRIGERLLDTLRPRRHRAADRRTAVGAADPQHQGHRAVDGATRTILEVVVPATTGWLALGGSQALPVALVAYGGWGDVARAWLTANWLFPLVVGSFALIHHGATSVPRAGAAPHGDRQIVAGYLVAVAVLAWAGSAVAALAVAGVFVIQWPYLANLRAGRVRWHLLSTQYATMGAMLAAFLGT